MTEQQSLFRTSSVYGLLRLCNGSPIADLVVEEALCLLGEEEVEDPFRPGVEAGLDLWPQVEREGVAAPYRHAEGLVVGEPCFPGVEGEVEVP